MRRRRFLQIVAGAALIPRGAGAQGWQGRAFGADIAISAPGGFDMTPLLREIAATEATFSLHRASELTRLNAAGRGPGSARMRAVLAEAGQVHRATDGAFDPTVQPLWAALAAGRTGAAEKLKIGFERIETAIEIRLKPGQQLTLNGIAQGYAADRMRALLLAQGVTQCLIDMGEYAALGGPFRLGIADPLAGRIGQQTLGGARATALACSSPGALMLAGGSHILGPQGQPALWSSVAVAGTSAMRADAASTAFVLMPAAQIARARDALDLGAVTLIDFDGNLTVI